MLSRSKLLALAVSQRIFSAFIIADADDLIDARKKNLPVTDFAGASGCRNCLHDFLNHRLGDDPLELDLGNKIDGVCPAGVDRGGSFRSARAGSLKDGHAFDSNLMQRILYAFQLGDLDDCFDFGHRDSYQSYAKISEAGIIVVSSRSAAGSRTRISSYSATGSLA